MRKILILALAIIMILNPIGCAKTALPEDTVSEKNPEAENSEIVEVTDFKGRKIVLDKIPQKIVSLSPSNTEILFALGLGERIVGATIYCDYPEEAKKIERVGDFEGPNMELIAKIKPDVVLAGYFQEEGVKALENIGITVIVTEAKSFGDIYKSIGMIGDITGTASKANEIIAGIKSEIAAIQAKTKDKEKPRIFYLVWKDPIMTAGSNTYINDIIKVAGGINVAEKVDSWVNYSAEVLLSDNPDILVAALHSTDEGMTGEDISKDPIFGKLECVKQGRVQIISDDNIISRPGPRVVKAIEEMNRVFYGE